MITNNGKIIWVEATDAVRDKAAVVSSMSNEEEVLLDMDFVGENMPQDDSETTSELRKIIEKAHEQGADYLLLFP